MFPFSGSGNICRCCFQPWVRAAGGTLTFLKILGNGNVLLHPGQVSVLVAHGTGAAVRHCNIL